MSTRVNRLVGDRTVVAARHREDEMPVMVVFASGFPRHSTVTGLQILITGALLNLATPGQHSRPSRGLRWVDCATKLPVAGVPPFVVRPAIDPPSGPSGRVKKKIVVSHIPNVQPREGHHAALANRYLSGRG